MFLQSFISDKDRANRARTSKKSLGRYIKEIGWIVLMIPGSIYIALTCLIREVKIGDSERIKSLEPGREFETDILVMPLAELHRNNPASTKKKEIGNRFLLMTHVGFDPRITAPCGETLGESIKIPGLENLRFVPDSFSTDFASIPAPLQVLVGAPTGSYCRAAVVHDWFYAYHHDGSMLGRKHCDQAMLKLMRQDGTAPWRRAMIYAGVRLGGGFAYLNAPAKLDRMLEGQQRDYFKFWYMRSKSFLLTYNIAQFEGPLLTVFERGHSMEVANRLQQIAQELIAREMEG